MLEAIAELRSVPEYVIVDALPLWELSQPHKPIVGGDARCLSIACASIVAKVARDALMVNLDKHHEGYAFALNKGYATRRHLGGAAPYGALSYTPPYFRAG